MLTYGEQGSDARPKSREGIIMPRFTAITLSSLALLSLAACNDGRRDDQANQAAQTGTASGTALGNLQSRDFKVANFGGIDLMSSDDVKVTQGQTFAVQARGPAADLDHLVIGVEAGMLTINRKPNAPADSRKVDINVTVPALSALKVAGSGELEAGPLQADVITLSVTGSGELKVEQLTAKQVEFTVAGSGDLEVKDGQIDTGMYRVAGSGDLDAENVTVRALTIMATGAGGVDAKASGTAAIEILGSGNVTVKGGARCTTKKVGSGQVRCS